MKTLKEQIISSKEHLAKLQRDIDHICLLKIEEYYDLETGISIYLSEFLRDMLIHDLNHYIERHKRYVERMELSLELGNVYDINY